MSRNDNKQSMYRRGVRIDLVQISAVTTGARLTKA